MLNPISIISMACGLVLVAQSFALAQGCRVEISWTASPEEILAATKRLEECRAGGSRETERRLGFGSINRQGERIADPASPVTYRPTNPEPAPHRPQPSSPAPSSPPPPRLNPNPAPLSTTGIGDRHLDCPHYWTNADLDWDVLSSSSPIEFASGSSVIPQRYRPTLDQIATAIAQMGWFVSVVGHANATGRCDRNLQLSQRRAKAVYDYLVQRLQMNGTNPQVVTALTFQGFGETISRDGLHPVHGGNRRVEFVVRDGN